MNKLVDIIIPVHNRWEHTKQTLESLLLNTSEYVYQLYVINDGSDDDVSSELSSFFSKYPDVKYLRNLKAIGPGASRNYVCDLITKYNQRGKYLYHSDNDVYFCLNWLTSLLHVYEDSSEKVKVLGGGCHPYLQNNEVFKVDVECSIGIKDAVSGYSQLMTWETWDKYGPFDETMRTAEKKIMGSEDWAFCQKIIKDGFLVGSIEPEVVIATGKTNTYGEPATGSETFKELPGIVIK